MKQYLRSTSADAITGMAAAYDGIIGSLVLLNGPLGCRFFHAYSARQAVIRKDGMPAAGSRFETATGISDGLRRSPWFCGTASIPGTNLIDEDYIYGSGAQLACALDQILNQQRVCLIAVIQTPGTSLLGEDLEPLIRDRAERFGIPYFFEESPDLSQNLWIGFEEAVLHILSKCGLQPNQPSVSHGQSVNLLGLSLYQRYLEGDVQELTRIFDLCGIRINCVVCGNCTLGELRAIGQADLNIVVYPEKGERTASYLQEKTNMPYYILEGPPIGFDAAEKMVRDICGILHADPSKALEACEQGRARAFYHLMRSTGGKGIARDLRYSIEGTCSELSAYVSFLSVYLGMVPGCISILCKESFSFYDKLNALIRSLGFESAAEHDIADFHSNIVLGNANTIMALRFLFPDVAGIETAYPTMGYTDVIPKTHLGINGTLFLLEQILNAIKFTQ